MTISMTGYGAAERTWNQWTVRVEVRSVNHGDLRVSARLPDMLRLKETDLAKVVKGKLTRGHVNLYVNCQLSEDAVERMVDRERLGAFLRVAKEAAAAEDVPLEAEAGALLSLPGVMGSDTLPQEVQDGLWEQVMGASQEALDGLIEMRRAEGEHLAAQLRDLCARIAEGTDAIDAQVPACVKDSQSKLVERVQQLLEGTGATVDEPSLARELAMLADKGDVSEEVTRMRSHLQQVAVCLESSNEAVGQKLEFLTQEMLREANTMGAKLPCAELVQQTIEIKTDVQRLREQVRNVE